MRVSQWGEYGLQFACYLAKCQLESGTAVVASDIADAHNVAVDYAQQILQRLRKGGVVESVRGAHGGYRLSKPASEMTAKEILLAAEGETLEILCDYRPIDAEKCAPENNCALRDFWHGLRSHVDDYLQSIPLSELTERMFSISRPVQIGGSESNSSTLQITEEGPG